MQLIGLTGRAGCGKDTIANFLMETHGFVQIALADPLRDGLDAMFGITSEQVYRRDLKEEPIDWIGLSPRQLMQTLGTEWGRHHVAPDIWLRVAARRIEKYLQAKPCLHIAGIVVSDIRFENEAEWLRSQGGSLWHIERAHKAHNVADHVSENGITRANSDIVIANDKTIADLEEMVAEILQEVC